MQPQRYTIPTEIAEASLLAHLDWRPSILELEETSENLLQYVVICKEVLSVARYGGKFDI